MEKVIKELNNMYTVVGDIISFVACVTGYGGARCCGKKNLVMTLNLVQPRVVLGEGLKDIHGKLYQGDL